MSLLMRLPLAVAAVALVTAFTGCSRPPADPAPQIAMAQGARWADTLASRNADNIAGLYAPDAVLLATFNNKVTALPSGNFTTPGGILKYFQGLSKLSGLRVDYQTQVARSLGKDTVSMSGLYTFSYREGRRTVRVPARYTFVWQKRDGDWKIIEHHSSVRPEKR